MEYNFVIKESTPMVILSGEFVAVQLSVVSIAEEKSWRSQI
jgi:hypothetical protein